MSAWGLGMTFPALAALFPVALALLIYAYRKKREREPVPVGTLLILKMLAGAPSAPRRFVPPLRFFFELLVLALLVAAATGLYLRSSADRMVLVIDNSLSMASVDASVSNRVTLLEQAKQRARDLLRPRLAGDLIAVYSAAGSLRALTDGFVPKTSAIEAIDGISAAREEDQLARDLRRLIEDHPDARIVAFSDHPFESSGDGARFRGETLGGPLRNIAIASAALEREAAGGSFSIQAGLVSFGASVTGARLAVESYGDGSSTLLATQSLSLAPGQSETVTLSSLKLGTGQGIRLRIEGADPQVNALSLDDEAYAAAFDETSRASFVSPAEPASLGLAGIRSMAFEHVSPERYVSDPGSVQGPFVFHRFVPPELPEGSSLIVMPPEGNPVLPAAPETAAVVTRWDDSEPLLSYINLPLLELRAVRSLRSPAWMREVLVSSAGPAIVVGESGRKRALAIGFELFPYEGMASPSASILLLNALKWLDASKRAGAAPRGEERAPGIHRSERGMVAVNFFSEAESDLETRVPVVVHAPAPPGGDDGRRPLHTMLGYVCLAMILADLLYSLARSLAAGRSEAKVGA